jgi:hypothetical protein
MRLVAAATLALTLAACGSSGTSAADRLPAKVLDRDLAVTSKNAGEAEVDFADLTGGLDPAEVSLTLLDSATGMIGEIPAGGTSMGGNYAGTVVVIRFSGDEEQLAVAMEQRILPRDSTPFAGTVSWSELCDTMDPAANPTCSVYAPRVWWVEKGYLIFIQGTLEITYFNAIVESLTANK